MNDYASGVRDMARNCLPACELLRQGRWSVDDIERWLNAIITNDPEYKPDQKSPQNPHSTVDKQ